jgi:hypothetical protein
MDSGSWIRKMREERFLRPGELERLSRTIAETTGNPDFYVSHGSLADIEAGAVPSIHKLFSLSCFLRVSYEDLLRVFGVSTHSAAHFAAPLDPGKTALVPVDPTDGWVFPFRLNFPSRLNLEETGLLPANPEQWPGLPSSLFKFDTVRYRYALIGQKDDTMGDLLPPGSLVEVDTEQNEVVSLGWTVLRERPIYLVWHSDGYTCSWCQPQRGELMLIPHALSRQPIRRYKFPREATIIGRVVTAWMSFVEAEPSAA